MNTAAPAPSASVARAHLANERAALVPIAANGGWSRGFLFDGAVGAPTGYQDLVLRPIHVGDHLVDAAGRAFRADREGVHFNVGLDTEDFMCWDEVWDVVFTVVRSI